MPGWAGAGLGAEGGAAGAGPDAAAQLSLCGRERPRRLRPHLPGRDVRTDWPVRSRESRERPAATVDQSGARDADRSGRAGPAARGSGGACAAGRGSNRHDRPVGPGAQFAGRQRIRGTSLAPRGTAGLGPSTSAVVIPVSGAAGDARGPAPVGASSCLGFPVCETGSSQRQPNGTVGRIQGMAGEQSVLRTVGGQ